MNRKAQMSSSVGNLPQFVAALVVTGISLAIALLVLGDFTTSEGLRTETARNDTTTITQGTNFSTICNPITSFNSICNATECISSGNYTLHQLGTTTVSSNISINDTNGALSNASYYVYYTCNQPTEATVAVNTTLYATGDVADWLDIVVVVVIAGVILSIVLVFGFGFGRRGAR